MLSFKNCPDQGEWKRHGKQSADGWKNWSPSSAEPEISLWVLDEPFEFGVLPMQPSSKISNSLLRKVSAYIKTKNMYPALNLSAWMHISQLKLQMGTHIPWIYLRIYDILKQQMNRGDKDVGYWDFRCEQLRKGRKDKKDEFRVPTFEFLIFLYVQNSYKIMKRMGVQIMNAGKRLDERTASKSSLEQKIQSEQLHYQYVYDNIEEIIDYLQEGYKSKEEVPLFILEALNLLLCCTKNPRECVMDPLEAVVSTPRVGPSLDFNPEAQTVNRTKFVQWIRSHLKLNPWGSASSFIHSPKIYPPTGPTTNDHRDVATQNRIIFNQKRPPNGWAILSNVCYQVFHHDQKQDFCNLKIHRCNNSYIYAPGLYNCVLVEKCNNATIFLGVTAKVVKFFNCTNVKVYCVGRLVVITDCIKSTFHLLTSCQPIFTGNKNTEIQLAPYNTYYPALGEHMTRADLQANVSCWNEPLQIGVDGMTAVESIAPVLSFLPPEEIRIFSFPFDQPGNTSENPLSLPDEYQEALDLMALEYEDWKDNWSSQIPAEHLRSEYEFAVLSAFKTWLISSGRGREIEGLINLEDALQEKDGSGVHKKPDRPLDEPESYEDVASISYLREMVGVFQTSR